jgi:hypothetical protein
MESGYHIVTIRVNETSWAHVWRLHSHYLRTGYDMAYVDRTHHGVQSSTKCSDMDYVSPELWMT